MRFLDSIERLINEHGSATILRERIALANDQYAHLEKKLTDLQAENDRLRAENASLKQKVSSFESKTALGSNPNGYACDHCGSTSLKRTGSRPDPTFGDLGVKEALFVCLECNKQSAFSENPR